MICVLRNIKEVVYCEFLVLFDVISVHRICICRNRNVLSERIEDSERLGSFLHRLYALVFLDGSKEGGKIRIIADIFYIESVFIRKVFFDNDICVFSKKII